METSAKKYYKDSNKNNNKNRNQSTNLNSNKEGNYHVKSKSISKENTNYKKVNERKSDFKRNQSTQSFKSVQKKPIQNKSNFSNAKSKQGSMGDKSNNFRDFNINCFKDDDDGVDLSHRSKPRDWKKQQKKEPELEILDVNITKVQRQSKWEKKRDKNKNYRRNKQKNKFDNYNYGYDDYENDGWN